MNVDAVKDAARRWLEIGNGKEPRALDEILAPDFVNHTPPPGNHVEMREITVDRVSNGRVVAQ